MLKSKKFQKRKNSYRDIFFSILLVSLFFIVIGFLVVSNWKISRRRAELSSRIEALKNEIQILEKKNQELKASLGESSKESYLEKEARERFNLKKPGEDVVSILPEESKEEAQKAKEKIWWNPLTW